MDKENVIHILSGILFSHKKNEIVSFGSDMDGTGRWGVVIILSETCQIHKVKYRVFSLINRL